MNKIELSTKTKLTLVATAIGAALLGCRDPFYLPPTGRNVATLNAIESARLTSEANATALPTYSSQQNTIESVINNRTCQVIGEGGTVSKAVLQDTEGNVPADRILTYHVAVYDDKGQLVYQPVPLDPVLNGQDNSLDAVLPDWTECFSLNADLLRIPLSTPTP